MRRTVAVALLIGHLAAILELTLVMFPGDHPPPNLVPFRSILHDCRLGGRDFLVNFAGNLAVFVPLGILLPIARRRPTSVGMMAALAVSLSVGIELAQFLSGRRVADVDDVILNALGAVLGFGILRLGIRQGWGHPQPVPLRARPARRSVGRCRQ